MFLTWWVSILKYTDKFIFHEVYLKQLFYGVLLRRKILDGWEEPGILIHVPSFARLPRYTFGINNSIFLDWPQTDLLKIRRFRWFVKRLYSSICRLNFANNSKAMQRGFGVTHAKFPLPSQGSRPSWFLIIQKNTFVSYKHSETKESQTRARDSFLCPLICSFTTIYNRINNSVCVDWQPKRSFRK